MLRNFSPSFSPSLARRPAPSRSLSLSRFEIRRVSTYAKSYSIRLRKIVPYDGGELMARVMGEGAPVVGRERGGGETEGAKSERERAARWGWIPRVGNGIPESLILLVNKCLGDSLLVHSYRPSFVSRRHCVLRFYLVFRSNGFWGLSRVASRVPRRYLFLSLYLYPAFRRSPRFV